MPPTPSPPSPPASGPWATAIPPLCRPHLQRQDDDDEGSAAFDDRERSLLACVKRQYYVKGANKASLLFFPLGLVFQDLLRYVSG